jgi:hypothetical protein
VRSGIVLGGHPLTHAAIFLGLQARMRGVPRQLAAAAWAAPVFVRNDVPIVASRVWLTFSRRANSPHGWLLARSAFRANGRRSLGGERALLERQAEQFPHVDQRFGEPVDQRVLVVRRGRDAQALGAAREGRP